MQKIQKIGKYLKGKPRLISKFRWQKRPEYITAYTDSDWAGCKKTARSTSGGVVCLGEHTLKTYCRQQKVIALSSAEAELYAMVAATAETLALQAYARDLGWELKAELYADSSAALGIAKRAGIGKVRHLRTQSLWVQEVRTSGRLTYNKILGEKNPADMCTKYLSAEVTNRHLKTINNEVQSGRAESAPEIDNVEKELKSLVVKWRETSGNIVRCSETIDVRPIPAIGKMRKCVGTSRSWLRGRWPNPRGSRINVSQAEIDSIDQKAHEPGKRICVNEMEFKTHGDMSGKVNECEDLVHEDPQENEKESGNSERAIEVKCELKHTCGIQRGFKWADADDDGAGPGCAACVLAARRSGEKEHLIASLEVETVWLGPDFVEVPMQGAETVCRVYSDSIGEARVRAGAARGCRKIEVAETRMVIALAPIGGSCVPTGVRAQCECEEFACCDFDAGTLRGRRQLGLLRRRGSASNPVPDNPCTHMHVHYNMIDCAYTHMGRSVCMQTWIERTDNSVAVWLKVDSAKHIRLCMYP